MTNIPWSKQPYQSTTMYHVGASLIDDFPLLSPFEKIEKIRPFIFSTDYPTPNNISSDDFKAFFEKMFISRFLNNYFKNETFEAFQIELYSKLMEVMPVYNSILSNFFLEKTDELLLNNYNETVDTSDTLTGKRDDTGTSKNKHISSAFPANLNTAGGDIGKVDYADGGDLDNGETKRNENTSESRTGKTTRTGYTGNRLDQLIKFDEHFTDIFGRLLGEFAGLFTSILF